LDTIAPFKITVCGIDELQGHCAVGVSHVLSILDPGWPVPSAFGAFGEHERLELRFNDVTEDEAGMEPPRPEHVAALLAFGRDLQAEPGPTSTAVGAHLLVHCHAGVSRSTAAMTLILAQALPERPAAEVVGEILRIRPQAWPNLRMVEMGDAMLGRGGSLVAAVADAYRWQIARQPGIADAMVRGGRSREVGAAVPGAEQGG
jgi:predicted protein tyrosine phosphatase